MVDSYLPDIHRLLPQSPDAEKGLLGSVFLMPEEILRDAERDGITASSFHIPAHQIIWQSFEDLRESWEPIDIITLTQRLRDNDKLAEAGGVSFVSSLLTFVPTASNAKYYSEIIKEKSTLRSIINGFTGIVSKSYDFQSDLGIIIEEMEQLATQIARSRFSTTERTRSMHSNVMDAIDHLEAVKAGTAPTGIKTGLTALDARLGGFQNGEVTVLTGVTGGGKTSLAHTILAHVAIELRIPVLIFSYEMPAIWVTKRLLCARGNIDTERMRTGKMNEADFHNAHHAAPSIASANITIEDNPDLGILELRSIARQQKSLNNTGLIIVDYLQKIPPKNKSNAMRQREVAEISDGIQKMAMELNIPVLALAQQNKDGEAREAGDIAFDAKTVLKIKREDEEINIEDEKNSVRRNIVIAKNNNGAVGTVPVMFIKNHVKFANHWEDK